MIFNGTNVTKMTHLCDCASSWPLLSQLVLWGPPDVFTSDTATLFSELFAFSFDLRPVTLYSKLCGFDCCTQHTKWPLYRRKCYSWQPNSWFSQTQATNSHSNQPINITQSVHFRLPVVDGFRKTNEFHWAESITLFKTNEESLFYSCLTDIK